MARFSLSAFPTGTNRGKTPDEILSSEDFISEVGSVRVNAVGVEAIQAALAKLPRGEFVLWLGTLREPSGATAVKIRLAPAEITNAVVESAKIRLDFQLQTP